MHYAEYCCCQLIKDHIGSLDVYILISLVVFKSWTAILSAMVKKKKYHFNPHLSHLDFLYVAFLNKDYLPLVIFHHTKYILGSKNANLKCFKIPLLCTFT